MSAKDKALTMTFVVYVDPEQGDIKTFVNHLANGFVNLFEHECEAHGVTNLTPQVLSEQRAENNRHIDPLEAMFNMPDAPEPTVKDDDEG